MREDKAELRAKIYLLERERENHELKVATLQSQQQAHLATIQHLQAQLHEADTEVSTGYRLELENRELPGNLFYWENMGVVMFGNVLSNKLTNTHSDL